MMVILKTLAIGPKIHTESLFLEDRSISARGGSWMASEST